MKQNDLLFCSSYLKVLKSIVAFWHNNFICYVIYKRNCISYTVFKFLPYPYIFNIKLWIPLNFQIGLCWIVYIMHIFFTLQLPLFTRHDIHCDGTQEEGHVNYNETNVKEVVDLLSKDYGCLSQEKNPSQDARYKVMTSLVVSWPHLQVSLVASYLVECSSHYCCCSYDAGVVGNHPF